MIIKTCNKLGRGRGKRHAYVKPYVSGLFWEVIERLLQGFRKDKTCARLPPPFKILRTGLIRARPEDLKTEPRLPLRHEFLEHLPDVVRRSLVEGDEWPAVI